MVFVDAWGAQACERLQISEDFFTFILWALNKQSFDPRVLAIGVRGGNIELCEPVECRVNDLGQAGVHVPNGSHVEQLQNAHVELVCQLRLLNCRTILSHEIKSLGNYEVGVDEALE